MSIEAEIISRRLSMGKRHLRVADGPIAIECVEEWGEASFKHVVFYRNDSCASGDHQCSKAPRLITDAHSPAAGPAGP